ncbi:MinD/ParA family protein [Metabacillus sp. 84]|uniref:MinD/ParA family protein n=1 Tax=unclassified Metabacillus TaxID=2675274 RepID=UPI003CF871A3
MDQAQVLRQMLAHSNKDSDSRAVTIGIASGKGGTGKTSFTVNFSLELVRSGKKVLLFDLDIGMGNVDILLGETAEYSIYDYWVKSIPMSKVIERSPAGIDYIGGGRSFKDFFQLKGRELETFLAELDRLTKEYDFIFFDMGAGMTMESLQFLLAADEIFLIVTPEPTSLMDAYSAAKHILLRKSEARLSIMINKARTRKDGQFAYERISSVISKFLSSAPGLLGILPDDPAVMEAVLKRKPVTRLYPKSKYSQGMNQAVSSFLKQESDNQPTGSSDTFMSRLKTLFKNTAGKGG